MEAARQRHKVIQGPVWIRVLLMVCRGGTLEAADQSS